LAPARSRQCRHAAQATKANKQPAGKKTKWRPSPGHRSRPELLVELLHLVAGWFPDRELVVCADSAFGGHSLLSQLPANVDLISQAHPRGVLYAPPPPQTRRSGRPRKKGERLADLQGWADDPKKPWQTLPFAQYGLRTRLRVKVQQALYYTAGKPRLASIDMPMKRPGRAGTNGRGCGGRDRL
jgi:hypothetical protein